MKPTAEIEAKGLKAYEQARAFERLRTWRLPVTYVFFTLLPVGMAAFAAEMGRGSMAALSLAVAGIIGGIGVSQWRSLKARYAENVRMLVELEKTYGDELSWVQVERHFAALEELKREMGEGG
jgi:hypothetical protein